MERAVAFYRDVLGLQPGTVSPYWSDFTVGGFRIGLHPGDGSGPGGFVLTLTTADLQAVLLRAEPYVRERFHQTPGGVVCTLADPDGNVVQVLQPGSTAQEFEP